MRSGHDPVTFSTPNGLGISNTEASRWEIVRSAANPLAATFLLSTALIANCTAQAQTIGNAGGSKRILVLHIVEVGSAKATSIKKHRWAIAAAKKKVVGRNLVGLRNQLPLTRP